MKKILLAGMLAIGAVCSAKAQEANAVLTNSTAYTIGVEFLGNPARICGFIPNCVSASYPTSASASSYSATGVSWPYGITGNYFNGFRLTYYLGGVAQSTVDFYPCGMSNGSYPLTFIPGPTININLMDIPATSTYSLTFY